MYVNRVSQSHEEEEGCVHNDVYTVNPCLTYWVKALRCTRHPPPIKRRKPRRRAIPTCSTDARAERRAPRTLTNSQNGGIAISESIKKKRGSGVRARS